MSNIVEKNKVAQAFEKRQNFIKETYGHLDCFRLINDQPDGFDGLTVDCYGPALLVEQHRKKSNPQPLIQEIQSFFGKKKPIFFKKRYSHQEIHRRGLQIEGESHSSEFTVTEGKLSFFVSLTGSEHTGLFLDSRPARELVQEKAKSCRVLNLFSYTGSLGVAAQAGGARSTTNIDVKNSALKVAQRNYSLNRLPFNTRTFLKSDAIQYLNRLARGKGRYDFIIVDPPPRFDRKNGGRFVTHKNYSTLISRCLRVLHHNGYLLAGLCTGSTESLYDEKFEKSIAEAAASTEISLLPIRNVSAGPDFPPSSRRPTARMILFQAQSLKNSMSF